MPPRELTSFFPEERPDPRRSCRYRGFPLNPELVPPRPIRHLTWRERARRKVYSIFRVHYIRRRYWSPSIDALRRRWRDLKHWIEAKISAAELSHQTEPRLEDLDLSGHLLEAVPRRLPEPPATGRYPDLGALVSTCHHQLQSPFFRLAFEVRERIYNALWDSTETTWHVFVRNGRLTHARCITGHDAPVDARHQLQITEDHPARDIMYPDSEVRWCEPLWSRRLLSSWCNHWACEEAALADSKPWWRFKRRPRSPFLPVLLTCKKM